MLQLKGKRDKIRSANIYIIFHIHIIKFVAFLAPQKLLFVYKKKKAEVCTSSIGLYSWN